MKYAETETSPKYVTLRKAGPKVFISSSGQHSYTVCGKPLNNTMD